MCVKFTYLRVTLVGNLGTNNWGQIMCGTNMCESYKRPGAVLLQSVTRLKTTIGLCMQSCPITCISNDGCGCCNIHGPHAWIIMHDQFLPIKYLLKFQLMSNAQHCQMLKYCLAMASPLCSHPPNKRDILANTFLSPTLEHMWSEVYACCFNTLPCRTALYIPNSIANWNNITDYAMKLQAFLYHWNQN